MEGREGGGREGELWKGGSEQVTEMETGVKDHYEHKDPNGGELPPLSHTSALLGPRPELPPGTQEQTHSWKSSHSTPGMQQGNIIM